MNGQEVSKLEDPLFATLKTWQRENPVRRRVNSQDLGKEQGNFVTFTGRFKSVRRPTEETIRIQLLDQTGLVEILTTEFIESDTINKVIFNRKVISA